MPRTPTVDGTGMDIVFYQLERQPLERALPLLLEKTLERGWKAVVEVSSLERRAALDDALWTYGERSFLPHGTDAEAGADSQPIVITASRANPNAADIRFLVDGARLGDDLSGYARVALIFDGQDEAALAAARADWKSARAGGHEASYFQQTTEGRWEKKA
jgi:DNA polymerase III subunit chi